MRSNPAPLPVGVRVHMNYESTFLTSVVPFDSNGARWELFLMYNEVLRELHIVLVQGDRSVYLIDRGFLEQSRFSTRGDGSSDSWPYCGGGLAFRLGVR